ncbi:MAG: cob(I)yrinic acid a,c-diamide adenosyltransferase [Elusimicrobia bacterium]|nr:cob(I)yrinic acid a,c-diamide adenosyltransferase [Elusimicrobiota bacterium]
MAKIYTKTGDKGQTGLMGGSRVPKNHPRVCAYGDVDELNSHLGVVLATLEPRPEQDRLIKFLLNVQNDLFQIGALLATPPPADEASQAPPGRSAGGGATEKGSQVEPSFKIQSMEDEIDHYTQDLPPLKNFILPGGSPGGAMLHLARTVCRRAERSVVELSSQEKVPSSILVYLNRLSDFLFTAARWINTKQGVPETMWKP